MRKTLTLDQDEIEAYLVAALEAVGNYSVKRVRFIYSPYESPVDPGEGVTAEVTVEEEVRVGQG